MSNNPSEQKNPYMALVPGSLWEVTSSFVGIDVALQKRHELSQKYYGKKGEIIFLVAARATYESPILKIWVLAAGVLVFIPWYDISQWDARFAKVTIATNR